MYSVGNLFLGQQLSLVLFYLKNDRVSRGLCQKEQQNHLQFHGMKSYIIHFKFKFY